jgi:hypothetical protein
LRVGDAQQETGMPPRQKDQNIEVNLPPEIALERIVTLPYASEVSTVSVDGLKRYHADKIIQLSPRRLGMKLRHALNLKS